MAENKATKIDGEVEVSAKITSMTGSDRVLATKIHKIVRTNAPGLVPRLWYGMPAYTKDGKIVCFFQSKEKFKTRYATFGFQHDAKLDEKNMWPVAFALTNLSDIEESKIAALVKKSVN